LKFLCLILFLTTSLPACDAPWFPGAWKTYEHPTYRFRIRVPSSWETIENTPFGAAALFRAPDHDQLFRSTINVLVQELKDPAITLGALAKLSEKQLELVLREYRVLSKAPLNLGPIKAREIRGSYFGSEGERRIRTIILIHKQLQYVITLSTSALQEPKIQKTLNRVLDSFQISGA